MRRIHFPAALLIAAAVQVLCGGPAEAQNFERYRPRPAEPIPFDPRLPSEPVAPATGSQEVLVDRLDAVIVLSHPDQIQPDEPFTDAEGLVLRFQPRDSLVYSGAFSSIVSRYVGRPITLRNLNEMAREIILLYRRAGQPVVDVIIPEQRITGGTVQIVIIESRVGEVRIIGDCRTDPHRLTGKVHCTRSGSRLYESSLRDDLFRLNDYPFRRVEVDLEPGRVEGTTDVNFQAYDVFPIRAYIGYEDTGVRNLLLERLFAGVTVGDPWGMDSLLSYQATTDLDFDHLNAHSVFYQVPISDCWDFEAYGSWAGIDPIAAAGINQSGEAWQAGFALNKQLTKSLHEESRLMFGFDFKSTNTNLEFGGVNVFASSAELVSLRLGYDLRRRYGDGGYFYLRNDLVIGPGPQFSPGNTRDDFSTVRPDTSPDFIYDRLRVERLWNLPRCWQLLARGTGQVANERLLFSETLGFGGYDSIRGYDQRTLNGDCGWLLSFELGPQPYEFGTRRRPQQLRWYGFVDMGDSYILHPQPGEDAQQFLISAGVGMRYSITNRLALRFDYGYGFQDMPNQANDNHQRIHLGVVALFGPQP